MSLEAEYSIFQLVSVSKQTHFSQVKHACAFYNRRNKLQFHVQHFAAQLPLTQCGTAGWKCCPLRDKSGADQSWLLEATERAILRFTSYHQFCHWKSDVAKSISYESAHMDSDAVEPPPEGRGDFKNGLETQSGH